MTQRTIKLWMLLVLHAAVGAGCGGPPTLQAPAEEVVPAKPLRIDVPDFFSARIDAGTFAPDGKTLAVSMLGGVRLWDLASGDLLDDTKKRAHFLVFSADGKRLATTHEVRLMEGKYLVINVWDVSTERRLRKTLTFQTEPWWGIEELINLVSFSPDGQELAGSLQGTVRVWDLQTGRERLRLPGGVAAQFSPDGKTLTTVTYAGLVRRWDAATDQLIESGARNTDYLCVSSVQFSSDGRLVAISDTCRICIKDTATNQTLRYIDALTGATPMAFLADNKILALKATKGIRLVDLATGSDLGWLSNPSDDHWAFSADGKKVVRPDGKSLVIEDTDALLARQEQPPAPSATDPPDVPLVAELVALRDTYDLELPLRLDAGFPAPSKVDLEFRLQNTGKQAIVIERIELPELYLDGPGAFNMPESSALPRNGGPGSSDRGVAIRCPSGTLVAID